MNQHPLFGLRKRRNWHRLAAGIATSALAGLFLGLAACTSGSPFYLARQGMGQARILLSRTPVDAALKESGLSEEQKRRLLHMGVVRKFALEELGLKDTESFRSVVILKKGQAVSYVVSAAPEFALTPRTWWFPIVGDVPYLGFFDKDDAVAFDAHLRSLGFDTELGEVAAYSTIGWFADPVFSSQLDHSEAYLTGLVIHEMVHSTIWLKGRPDFNEALASFVEEKGRLAFYAKRDGPDSSVVRHITDFQGEERKYNAILDEAEKSLRELYASNLPDDRKRLLRRQLYEDLRSRLVAARSSFKLLDPSAFPVWNNARFATRAVYRPSWPGFEITLGECREDLACFMKQYAVYAQNPAAFPDRFHP